MLYTIAVVMLILWLLGLITSYTMGGFFHRWFHSHFAGDRHRGSLVQNNQALTALLVDWSFLKLVAGKLRHWIWQQLNFNCIEAHAASNYRINAEKTVPLKMRFHPCVTISLQSLHRSV